VALDSSRAEAHRFIAMVVGKKDSRAALAELKKTCALNPTDDEACLRLARAYGRTGQLDQERDTYLATIARRPHCWQPYWWLATWHFHRGEIADAAQAFREMIRRSPDYSEGYTDLGGVLVLRGDYASAIDTLKRSIALRPNRNAFD